MKAYAIFDLDGTLLDSIDDLADACNHALSNMGLPVHAVEPYRTFVGDGVRNLMLRCLPEDRRDEETVTAMLEGFNRYYGVHSRDKTRPYPGIPALLQTLRDAGVAVAVLSNKPDRYTRELTELYFPGLVDIAYGQREGVPIKPDPAAVHEIAVILGVSGQPGFYSGDTATDMETGRNAGLFTIGVSWGFRTRDELERAGAHVIVDKASQLGEIIIDKIR